MADASILRTIHLDFGDSSDALSCWLQLIEKSYTFVCPRRSLYYVALWFGALMRGAYVVGIVAGERDAAE